MFLLNLHRDCPLAYTLFVPRKMCKTCRHAVSLKDCSITVECIRDTYYGLRRTKDSSCGEWEVRNGK